MGDFIPYGFCEKWMAERLGIGSIEFPLSDCTASAICESDYQKIARALQSDTYHSTFADAYVLVHKYYKDISVLDSLTTGETKSEDSYSEAVVEQSKMTQEEIEDKAIELLSSQFTIPGDAAQAVEIPADAIARPAPTVAQPAPAVAQPAIVEVQLAPAVEMPEAEEVLDIKDGIEGIEDFMDSPNVDYIAKIKRWKPDSVVVKKSDGRFVLGLDMCPSHILESIELIEKFAGKDVVVCSTAVYGQPDTEMISVSRYHLDGQMVEIGMPKEDICTITSVGQYEFSNSEYSKQITPYSEEMIDTCKPTNVPADTLVKCGDYNIGQLVGGRHLKLFHEIHADVIIHAAGSLNGEKFDFTINHAAEVFGKMLSKKSNDGYYVYMTGHASEAAYNTLKTLADSLKRNILFTPSRTSSPKDAIRTTFGITVSEYNNIKDSTTVIFTARQTDMLRERDGKVLVLGVEARNFLVPESGNGRGGYDSYDFIFRDTVSNTVFALQKGANIMIVAGGERRSNASEASILEGILFRLNKNRTYEEINAFDKGKYEEILTESKTEYCKLFVKDNLKVITDMQSSLEADTQKFSALQDQLMALAGSIKKQSIAVSSIDKDKLEGESIKNAEQDFQNILDIDVVSNVVLAAGVLNVYTNNVYVQHDHSKKWYDIGTFHISIKVSHGSYNTGSGESGTTRILNTKTSVYAFEEGMNAPHVFRGGHLCHGNLGLGVSNSWKDGDMFGVVFQIIMFLQSANLDDVAGTKVDRWEEVTEEVALKGSTDSKVTHKIAEVIGDEYDNDFAAALGVTAS